MCRFQIVLKHLKSVNLFIQRCYSLLHSFPAKARDPEKGRAVIWWWLDHLVNRSRSVIQSCWWQLWELEWNIEEDNGATEAELSAQAWPVCGDTAVAWALPVPPQAWRGQPGELPTVHEPQEKGRGRYCCHEYIYTHVLFLVSFKLYELYSYSFFFFNFDCLFCPFRVRLLSFFWVVSALYFTLILYRKFRLP